MIVKDEAPVIARCLASVRPFIDAWLIVDTGSSDRTPEIVREQLADVPGALHHRAWRSFGENRTEALELARGSADYLLFIDADEWIDPGGGLDRTGLTADAYNLPCSYAGTSYPRCALVATRLPWRWEGVVHEALACDSPHASGSLPAPAIVVEHDGARSRDPLTYSKDAALLEASLQRDLTNRRTVFYLAQSYRDAGELARSRERYQQRAAMGGWEEEVWFSCFQAAVLAERLGGDPATVAHEYLAAYQLRPSRAEPLVELARFHRGRFEYALAFLYARRAAECVRPADVLFVDEHVYTWRALDELTLAAFYAGHPDVGRRAMTQLLEEHRYPAAERSRLLQNAACYTHVDRRVATGPVRVAAGARPAHGGRT
jgi:glycosyltransferase involved in cell wall biosynthesis